MEMLIILATLGLPKDMPLCRVEDQTNCIWRADVQGNGMGRSFVSIDNGDGTSSTIYLDTVGLAK